MNKKKILALCHSPFIGGAELALASLISTTHHDYSWGLVFPIKSAQPEKKLLNNIDEVFFLDLPWWCYEAHDTPNRFNEKEVRKNLKQLENIAQDFDILLTNTITIPWLGFTASKINKPHIWYIHEFGDIDHNLQFYLGYSESLKKIAATSNRVLTISEAVSKHLEQIIPKRQIDIIHQSIDLKKLSTIKPSNKGCKALSLGAIKPSKGQHIAIKAVELYNSNNKDPIHLDVVGPDAHSEYVSKLVEASQQSNEISIQTRPYDPAAEFSTHNVLLMTSENEALGRVTLEGLASGVIIVGYASPSTKNLLKNERGILYSPNTPEELEVALRKISTFEKSFNAEANRTFVESQYSDGAQKNDFVRCVDAAYATKYTYPEDHIESYIEHMKKQHHTMSSKDAYLSRTKNKVRRYLPSSVKERIRKINF